MSGYLLLEDGTAFTGQSTGAPTTAFGEAVFTTAMTGYQEVVTDPSFTGQIISFTAPMVGNYGVDPSRDESTAAHARAVGMREARGPGWTEWLTERGLPALTGVDTRSVVLHLRDRGAMRAAVVCDGCALSEALEAVQAQPSMAGAALAPLVSCEAPYVFSSEGTVRIAVVDYGAKRSIPRRLANQGAAVTVVPHNTPADELAAYDGVVLSNGPGDPAATGEYAVPVIRKLIEAGIPTFGICLGHQMLGIAVGGKTMKMHQGHHGANHPVKDLSTEKVEITLTLAGSFSITARGSFSVRQTRSASAPCARANTSSDESWRSCALSTAS